jgi:hypothetical protein
MLPGRQPLHYHLCSSLQLDDLESKANWSLMLLLIFSLVIHIFVNVKIKILKLKKQKSHDVITFSDHLKSVDITLIDKQSISDFLTSFLSIAASSFLIIVSFIINWINPLEFTKVTFFCTYTTFSSKLVECTILQHSCPVFMKFTFILKC